MDSNRKNILIITDKQFFFDGNNFYSTGGTPSELNALANLYNINVLAPVHSAKLQKSNTTDIINKRIKIDTTGHIKYPGAMPAFNVYKKIKNKTEYFCKHTRPDVVIGKCPREVGMLGVIYASKLKIPTILHYSYDWFDNLKQYMEGKKSPFIKLIGYIILCYRHDILKKAIENATYVATVSNNFIDRITLRYSLPRQKLVIMRNTFSQGSTYSDIAPVEVDLSVPKILYVGRIDANKNISTLLKAAKLLKDRRVSFLLYIVGDGPDIEYLKSVKNDYQLDGQVEFIGWVPNHKIPHYLSTCRCLVLISKSEAFPQVIVEAFSAARPVVGSSVGGIPELITDKVTGFLIDPDDVQSLSNSLELLLKNSVLARDMGLRARAFINSNYSIDATIAQWKDHIEKVCS